MLKLADLANRADFDAGPLHISPARRLVTGPAGSVSVEPIVMKVFLLLLDGGGEVVTRDDLFANAWGGVFVGDDSLNRAIGRVRKIATDAAPGLFEIETIPRTGYRLTGDILNHLETPAEASEPGEPRTMSRRLLLGGTTAAAIGVGGGLLWRFAHPPANARFDSLMDQGQAALRQDVDNDRTMDLFKQAVALVPNSAKAWGLLAYTQSIGLLDARSDQTSARARRSAMANNCAALTRTR